MSWLFFISPLFFSWLVSAQPISQSAAPSPHESCQPEIRKFCADVPVGPKQLQCLVQNEKNVSTLCQQEIQRLTQLLKQGGGLSSFGGVMGGMGLMAPNVPMITYSGAWAPETGPVAITQHRASVSSPVYQNETDSISLSLTGQQLHFGEVVPMAGAPAPLATDFYRVELGAQFSRRLEAGKMAMLRTSVGSASDQLFGSGRDLTFSVAGSYGYPGGENRYWIWSLFISNNSPIGNYVPIPGFMYFYKSDTFTGMFGLPMVSLNWTPVHPWAFSLTAFGPSLTTEISYGPRDRLQGFLGFSWMPQTFLRDGRSEEDDRVFFDEKKSYVGLRSPLNKQLSAELQLGHAFNRSVYEGEGLGNRERGSADLDDSWYISLSLRTLLF